MSRKSTHHRYIRMKVCFLMLGVRNRSTNEGLCFSETSSSTQSIWERVSLHHTWRVYTRQSPREDSRVDREATPNPHTEKKNPSEFQYLQVGRGQLPVLLSNLLHNPYGLGGSLLGQQPSRGLWHTPADTAHNCSVSPRELTPP